MNNIYLALFFFIVISASCNSDKVSNQNRWSEQNPFYKASTLPFEAPDFNNIKNTDFLPAFEEGMKEHLLEVEKIANSTEAPTVENTLVQLEKSNRLLSRVSNVFNLLTSANTNDTLQKIDEEIAPKLAAHEDAITLNSKLFKRIETLYQQRDSLPLDKEGKRLVTYYYQQFVLKGAKLSENDKNELKKLNEEEAKLRTKFTNQLLAATKAGAVSFKNKADLEGLSDGDLAAMAKDGQWTLSLQNTTQQPALQTLTKRETRKKLFDASWDRAAKGDKNDTRSTLARIAEIRAEKAKLMGFESYAAWKLQDQMAKTPAVVEKFLADLVPAATAKAQQEAHAIQKVIDQEKAGFQLAAWDWDYYAEKVRKAKFDLDEGQIKPYFELHKVLEDGVFYAAKLLYGISFKERKDIPVYQADVRVFEVFEEDGKSIGLFYGDYFKRDNKSGGAWMSNLVDQSTLLHTKPVIYNVCNFTKPADGQPALISYDDVITMFHEFGHALHGLFANQQYPSLSGTSVARDFVEFPSQFNEHWALDPLVFKHYALHYQTGKSMPQALVDKIKKAGTFNQGYALTELLASASLDMSWHTLKSGDKIKQGAVDEFEKQALTTKKLDLPQVPPRYRSSYFLHIWGNGYAAGYYAYLWTEMLDDDAYAWFEENGGLTRANGQRFRDMILSKGNTEEYEKMFKDFRGHAPEIEPMLKNRGLK
ncbi:peptidyl-dipeptidase Dcp [Olivibacter ginsenosidimutans]|uniref:Peptidyl-dipeptidase Dcp n=1 Tax=Olivibacter ginsenosidimutans TaxID=1176537 RepID=A0ABP9BZU0_9SPHI